MLGQQHVWVGLHSEQQQAHCSFKALMAFAMVAAHATPNLGYPLQPAGSMYLLHLAGYGHHRFQADLSPKVAQLRLPSFQGNSHGACQGLT